MLGIAPDCELLRRKLRRGYRWSLMRVMCSRIMTKLLQDAYDQESARFFVAAELADVLREWGVRRPLTPQD